MKWIYLLCDDNGVSNIELPILINEGCIFTHEYGRYKVEKWIDNEGVSTPSELTTQVICERL